MQAKATPIREAVVVIEDTTTMDDLKKLAKRFNDRFGIDVFQIAIHKDEGYKKSKDGIKLNLHAHLVADWTDHESGKSLKLNRNDMAEMQGTEDVGFGSLSFFCGNGQRTWCIRYL